MVFKIRLSGKIDSDENHVHFLVPRCTTYRERAVALDRSGPGRVRAVALDRSGPGRVRAACQFGGLNEARTSFAGSSWSGLREGGVEAVLDRQLALLNSQ